MENRDKLESILNAMINKHGYVFMAGYEQSLILSMFAKLSEEEQKEMIANQQDFLDKF